MNLPILHGHDDGLRVIHHTSKTTTYANFDHLAYVLAERLRRQNTQRMFS